ncbi:MAG TPA: DUF4350 domain-containing protein [Gemmatimonadales bacterium]|nr:DUF4350 domain-containing protein [Gemmatimonadales bacterium]
MRPRVELGLAAGILAVLAVGVAMLGSRRARTTDTDTRRSTYLAGPSGASAWAEALGRLGVRVERYRRPTLSLRAIDRTGVFAVIGPDHPLDAREGAYLAALPGDLLLAGDGADRAMACLGYRVDTRWADPAALKAPPGAEQRPMPRARAELVRHLATTIVDSSEGDEGHRTTCSIPPAARVDTLLRTVNDRAVALRVAYAGGRTVTLVADDGLFRNRTLRRTAAGPIMLGLVTPRYRRVVVDEFHQGFSTSGTSLAGATLAWSTRSPWGWIVWQLVAVGVIALVASGIRFGPARQVILRRRRSPLEHVRALATALAASRGHETAVRLMAQGLRRRLSRAGRVGPADLDRWLAGLASSLHSERGYRALATLTDASSGSPTSAGVLEAANAVEILWDELKPS